jgi:hypothetical protein
VLIVWRQVLLPTQSGDHDICSQCDISISIVAHTGVLQASIEAGVAVSDMSERRFLEVLALSLLHKCCITDDS